MLRSRTGRAALAVAVALMLLPLGPTLSAQAGNATVTANFAAGADYPLVKSKFGLFNSGYVSPSRWARDAPLVAPLRPARFRWELMWGHEQSGWTPMVGGTAGAPTESFGQVDQVVDEINAAHAQPVPILAYDPTPLQPSGGTWQSPPANFATWANNVVPAFVNHWKNTGRPIGSYEVWNEPDLPGVFWSGTEAQYLSLYGAASQAIRAANPDGYVEGPALCCAGWNSDFVNYVKNNNLPLDGFSFHGYGDPTTGFLESGYQGATDSGLTAARFATTDNNLNEFNYTNHFTAPTDITNYRASAELLKSFKSLLAKPWINHVEWAQFQDPICPSTCDIIGLLDQNGHKRASYNAFQLYANMPVDRKALTINGSVDGMASSDGHKAGMLLWNTSGSDQTVSTALQNVPFTTGNFRVWRIDATHASYGDNSANENLTPVQQNLGVSTSGLGWNGTIPDHGVVYVEAEDGTGTDTLAPVPVATPVKDVNYDPDHGKTSWSSFDRNTWTAQLGMASENFADAETGEVATGLPSSLRVKFAVQGTPAHLDANSALGLRIDYATGTGYSKGVFFHGGLYDPARSAPAPFGTQRQPDQVVQVPSLADFTISPSAYAPSGWNGRATISYVLQNAGAGVRAAVTTRAVTSGPEVISLRSHANGRYVTADNAGSSPLIANRTAIGSWEQFDLIDDGGGYFSLKSHANGQYVSADNAGATALIANRPVIGTWEQFQIIHNGDGSIAFRSRINGEYVCADNAGASPLIANCTAIGQWESFDQIG
jgi:hypothetical protein